MLNTYKHINTLFLSVFLYFAMGVDVWAQLTVEVGETTTLSVEKVSGVTYVWELYDQYENVNFVNQNIGNCPETKAVFVKGNTGSFVSVNWLQSGTYMYKVWAKGKCADNIKTGMVVVENVQIPEKPNISVMYNCTDGTATLEALNYQGDLLWNTGEKSSSITVDKSGVYTLVQVVNGVSSLPAEVSIFNLEIESPDIVSIPTYINLGESVTLSTTGCSLGNIRWYSDKALTQEIINLTIQPDKNVTYYAICTTDTGCESTSSELVLVVNTMPDCDTMYEKVSVHNAISPNGDGQNDVWEITELEDYCNTCGSFANVEIYDRWGDIVFRQDNYTNSTNKFKGKAVSSKLYGKDSVLPTGTYFYIITVKGKKAKTGWLYILNTEK